MRAVAGFRPLYNRFNSRQLTPIPYLMHVSVTLSEGSAVKFVANAVAGTPDGVAPADAAADTIFGYVTGFVTPGQHPLQTVSDNSTYVDGTYTAAPTGDSYASTSDNNTDKKIMAMVVPSFGVICSAKLDATAGTTTGSDEVGHYSNIVVGNETLIDESTAAAVAVQQFISDVGRSNAPDKATDPVDPTNRIFVSSAEDQRATFQDQSA